MLSWDGCGYTREQIVGKPFWPWRAPSPVLVDHIGEGAALAAAGQSFRAEMPDYAASTVERFADVSILPIKDEIGNVLFLAPTGIDITERRRVERELRESAVQLEQRDEQIRVLKDELQTRRRA